jgi:hypothetical protein
MTRILAGTLALLGALVLQGDAQSANQPIYLQYDGFVRNTDAHTITLSFGYWNLNHTDIKIEPGPDNQFLPAPIDRMQPTTLQEGRHRFACTIVVPETFAGDLKWQVRYAGKVATSTEKVLNPLYELEISSGRKVMTGLDPKTAPKNVCANHAPTVTIGAAAGGFGGGGGGVPDVGDDSVGAVAPTPSYSVILDQELTLPAQVQDDELPRNRTLTINWKKNSGPGTVTFATPTVATTKAKFSAAGAYELALTATDGALTTETPVKVTVNPVGYTTATEKAPESYAKAMKDIQANQTTLRTTIGAKNYAGVAQSVATLKSAFTTTQAYWADKGKQDAITAANNALKAIADLETATAAKNDPKLIEAQTALGRTCASCHTAHRQSMGAGAFEIK